MMLDKNRAGVYVRITLPLSVLYVLGPVTQYRVYVCTLKHPDSDR